MNGHIEEQQAATTTGTHLSLGPRGTVDGLEVLIVYQPIYRTLDGALCGCEALARLRGPDRILSPAEFIPALEKSGRVAQLDSYVLEKTCSDWSHAHRAGIVMPPVSINFSRRDFSLMDVPRVVASTARRHRISHGLIRAEVTESCIAHQEEELDRQLRELRSQGFEVWMDDFGSGYSSLAQLALHDFDVVKLDTAFLTHFDQAESREVLAAALAMLRSLGMRTLVEGVETAEQYHFVRLRGAEFVQGFYLARPMAFEDLCRVAQKMARQR